MYPARVEAPAAEPPRDWRRTIRTRWPLLVLAAAVLAVVLINTRVIFSSLHNATFQTDAWEMLNDGRTWRSFFASEWRHVFDGRDRFRPTTHLVFDLYVRLFGVDAEGFARVLWGLVLALQALQGVYLTRLGFRPETALLALLFQLFSQAYLGTTYAHQYNDLILAAVFTFATLNLCLRAAPRPAWVPLAVLVVGVGAHESGVLCGPLLVLSYAYRDGLSAWRTWSARADARAVVAFSVGYAALRFTGGAAVHSGLVGSSAITHNYAWLLGHMRETLWPAIESPGALLRYPRYLLNLLLRQPQGLLVPWALLALLALRRARDPRDAARLAAFAAAWVVVTYAPFALNPRYGSITYVCVSLLLPAAALLHPIVEWAATWPSPLRAVGLLAAVALIYPQGIHRNLRFTDRLAAPLFRAITGRAAATAPRERFNVWIIENHLVSNNWGRSPIEEELQMMPTHESLAVRQLVRDRTVPIYLLTPEAATRVRPQPHDLLLVAEGQNPRYLLWEYDYRTGAPRLIFGAETPELTPPLYGFAR